jgi:hypothetical protein
MVHTCNLSTWEAKAELWVQGQPALYSETLSQKEKERDREKKMCKKKIDTSKNRVLDYI